MKNQLTILLTLKDRPEYTKRWLAYAEKFHCPFSILIADGSKTEENAGIIKNYLSVLSIEYRRYPFDQYLQNYYHKAADAASQVKTPYVIRADNDDFYDFAILSDGVHFLQNNKQYTSYSPGIFNFLIQKDFVFSSRCYNNAQPIWKDKASERIALYFSGSAGAYYNIHDANFYARLWKDIECFNFSHLRLHEILIDVASYAYGNIAVSKSCGYFREESGQGNTSQLESNMLKEMMSAQWGSENAQVANYIVEMLIERDEITLEAALNEYYNGLRNMLSVSVVRDLLLDKKLPYHNRKSIYQLFLKDIISHSRMNTFARKLFSIKNRKKNTEPQFLPVKNFLETWHFGDAQ